MPYIAQEDREFLDPHIERLTGALIERAEKDGHDAAFAGLLNYAVSSMALGILKKNVGKVRYWFIATLTGTLKNTADEFYRRVAAPYEDGKIRTAGDLPGFEEFGAPPSGPRNP